MWYSILNQLELEYLKDPLIACNKHDAVSMTMPKLLASSVNNLVIEIIAI